MIAAVMFTGCDFFRSILGKPTSKEIEKMRIEALARAKRKRQIDSINRLKADSIKFAEAQKALANKMSGRYYIILGSFKVQGNASKMLDQLKKDGYKPANIKFKNGFDLVAAAAYDDFRTAFKEMDKILEYENCPDDVWIYDTQQGLHEEI